MTRIIMRNILEYACNETQKRAESNNSNLDEPVATENIFAIKGDIISGKKVKIYEGPKGIQKLCSEKDGILAFVKTGGKVIVRGLDNESVSCIRNILPLKVRKIIKDELPIYVREDGDIPLYNRDLYWVEPHSEFGYGWAGFKKDIAEFAVELDSSDHSKDCFSFIPFTRSGRSLGKSNGETVSFA